MNQPTLPGFHPFMKSNRPRPKITDEAILRNAAKALVKSAKKAEPSLSEENDDEMIDNVVSAIRYEVDGYAICRELESLGWDPDAALVEVFDHAEADKRSVLDKAVLQWVLDTQVTLRFPVGAKIEFFDRSRATRITGEILKLDPQRAQYTVFCEALGHVRKGSGVRGVIRNDEDCELLEETVA